MGLDLRIPISMMFGLFGAILVGVGILGDASLVQKSLGDNMNLTWGCVLLVFSLAMFAWQRIAPIE